MAKGQTCQTELNSTLLIIARRKNIRDAEMHCSQLNGHILRKSRLDDIMFFLSENMTKWAEICWNRIWTGFSKASDPQSEFEFFDLAKNRSDYAKPSDKNCFICVLDQKRTIFKATIIAYHGHSSFSLKNDESGSLLLVSNKVQCFLREDLSPEYPTRLHCKDYKDWENIAEGFAPHFPSGIFNLTQKNHPASNTKEDNLLKVSNVSR